MFVRNENGFFRTWSILRPGGDDLGVDPPRSVQVCQMSLEDDVLEDVPGGDLVAVDQAAEAVVHSQRLNSNHRNCESSIP